MKQKQLIKKLIQGDKRAERELFEIYYERVLNFICQKANPADAEEIVQDTFVSALKSLPRFNGNSKLSTWLFSIARHELADFYRKKKIKKIVFSRLPFLEGLVSEALSPELSLEEKELKQKISQSLKSINEGYWQILRLKYRDGLSMKQISRQLKITVKAVESRLFRARRAFKHEFKQKVVKTEKLSPVWTAYWD
jgi:RNA polymerase sigma-70 factor (ECF subfamily)